MSSIRVPEHIILRLGLEVKTFVVHNRQNLFWCCPSRSYEQLDLENHLELCEESLPQPPNKFCIRITDVKCYLEHFTIEIDS